MRNTPLWRPQPSSQLVFDIAEVPARRGRRVSVAAMMGLGLTIAVGIGVVGAFAVLDDGAVESAVAAVPASTPAAAQPETRLPDVATREPLVGRVPAATATVQPPVPAQPVTIDVAVAQNEGDVARLEEMTGMVAPNAVPPAATPVPDATVTDGLRPTQTIPGAENVVVPPEPDATATDDATETASIQPDEAVAPAEGKPAEQQAAAAIALPPLTATKVSRYVNLRSGPADESRVITVVPAGATVQAQNNCGWCVVTYKGQRGYIYKSFLARGGATASNDPAPAIKGKKPGLY